MAGASEPLLLGTLGEMCRSLIVNYFVHELIMTIPATPLGFSNKSKIADLTSRVTHLVYSR
jgi:hypothetical protein